MTNNTLRLAIQKSGRLNSDSIDLITECGISINRADNKLKATAKNFPLEILYLRDDDIPEYVADGVVDLGIVGENLVIEKQRSSECIQRLGFARCRLSIAIPEQTNYQGLESLQNIRIATSYPNTLKAYLKRNNIYAEVKEIRGSAEIAPSIGLADAVCDLVSSGSTLLSCRLKEVEEVLKSEALLIQSPRMPSEKQELVERLLFRISAVQRANSSKYILLNAPNESLNEIIELIPGMKSPTVLPLADPGWSSVHSVINEDDFWNVIESLKQAGAEGILVIPIEKMCAV